MAPLSEGGHRGAPGLAFALPVLVACALFVRLGFWQWHRGTDRQAEWQRFERGAQQLVPLGSASLQSVPLYQRVSVEGSLDGAHQFLLDNRSYRERPGYEVLTPLTRAGASALLIDRGWVPFSGARANLPDVRLGALPGASFTGRVALLPSAGLALGRAPPQGAWPKVTSFPSMDELASALGAPLEPRILLLDAHEPGGYVRDWQAPGISALRHFSYAIQWWCFAGLTVILWAVMTVRGRKAGRP